MMDSVSYLFRLRSSFFFMPLMNFYKRPRVSSRLISIGSLRVWIRFFARLVLSINALKLPMLAFYSYLVRVVSPVLRMLRS
jgi:hypothetical protein